MKEEYEKLLKSPVPVVELKEPIISTSTKENYEYHTIKSFYNYLKRRNQDFQVYFSTSLEFYNVKFTGVSDQTYKSVNESDEWNNLGLFKTKTVSITIRDLLTCLEKYIDKKGDCTITINKKLILTKKPNVFIKFDISPKFWCETHLNTYKIKQEESKNKLQQELDKFNMVFENDSDLLMKFLTSRLKDYPDINVYIVGNKTYVGLDKLKEAYPDYNSGVLFKSTDNIHKCILPNENEFGLMVKMLKTHNLSIS